MISDIRSTLNQTSNKQNNGPVLSNTATLAKLINEIKFIENMSLIKIQGSETLNHQGKPAQLLHALSGQQPFTIINTGIPVDINDLKSAQLNKTNPLQATLTTTKEALPSQTAQGKTSPQVNRVGNLVLASRVLNLTVISTPIPTNNAANTAPQQTAQALLPTNTVQVNTAQTDTYQIKATTAVTTANPIQTGTTQISTAQPTTNQTNTAQTNNSAAPVNSTPANSAPVNSTPVNSTPVNSTPVNSTPVNSKPVNSTPVNSTPVNSTPVNSTPVNSAPVDSVQPNTSYVATVTNGKAEFPILSQTELKRGDVVRVLVDMNNNMQALPPKTAPTTASSHTEALKQSLPKQLTLGEMSQLIKQLHTANESSSSTLPLQTQQALKQLMQGMPNLNHLTTSPEAMKQAIQTSGVFSESLLLQDNKTQLPEDLKLNLSRLKETQEMTGALRLGSIPTEQIVNAVERITTSQLRHFSETNQISTASYPLHIELPIRDATTHSLVQIEINKDANSDSDKKQDRRWLVKLKFDFEETGKFEARTSIQANKVSIIFVAEDKKTLQKLQQNIPILKKQLTDKEIDVERLDTFQAKLTQKETSNQILNKPLIDVRT
jgi:hypothetical protein